MVKLIFQVPIDMIYVFNVILVEEALPNLTWNEGSCSTMFYLMKISGEHGLVLKLETGIFLHFLHFQYIKD